MISAAELSLERSYANCDACTTLLCLSALAARNLWLVAPAQLRVGRLLDVLERSCQNGLLDEGAEAQLAHAREVLYFDEGTNVVGGAEEENGA